MADWWQFELNLKLSNRGRNELITYNPKSNRTQTEPICHKINWTVLEPNLKISNLTGTDKSETHRSQNELGRFTIFQT